MTCDFCGDPVHLEFTKAYACEDFAAEIPGQDLIINMIGPWHACPVCANFVDHNEWSELAQHSLICYKLKHGVVSGDEPGLLDHITTLHDGFRAHRPPTTA